MSLSFFIKCVFTMLNVIPFDIENEIKIRSTKFIYCVLFAFFPSLIFIRCCERYMGVWWARTPLKAETRKKPQTRQGKNGRQKVSMVTGYRPMVPSCNSFFYKYMYNELRRTKCDLMRKKNLILSLDFTSKAVCSNNEQGSLSKQLHSVTHNQNYYS